MGIFGSFFRNLKKQINTDHDGSYGESQVKSKLNPLVFGKVEHRLLNDYMILDNNGKSHQIDHIEIRSNGIFCIETKNYKGIIMGSENSEKWTQCLFNHERYQMINPVRQNKSHVYHLNKLLGGRYKINSVIVMVQNNAKTLKIPNVVNLCDLKGYLSSFDDGTNYSSNQIENIYSILVANESKVSKKEHIKSIYETKKNVSEKICPRCGKNLVLRKSQYGPFYGCSGYPNCNFIKRTK